MGFYHNQTFFHSGFFHTPFHWNFSHAHSHKGDFRVLFLRGFFPYVFLQGVFSVLLRSRFLGALFWGGFFCALLRGVLLPVGAFTRAFSDCSFAESFSVYFFSEGFFPCGLLHKIFSSVFSQGLFRALFCGVFALAFRGVFICELPLRVFSPRSLARTLSVRSFAEVFNARFEVYVLSTWKERFKKFFWSFMMKNACLMFYANPFMRSLFTQPHHQLKLLQLASSWFVGHRKRRDT